MQGFSNMVAYPPSSPKSSRCGGYEDVLKQVESLDWQNKQLLSIADNIMKTSFLRHYDHPPQVIAQLEEDMKMSFNTLIESIREFFMSIDGKVKELAEIIEAKMVQGDSFQGQTAFSPSPMAPGNDKMDNLVMRIAYMEQNIKKSQENEAKLISIIEDMNNKKIEEQPTIRKDNERGTPYNGKPMNYSSSTGEQNSFRLFSMGGNQEKKGFVGVTARNQPNDNNGPLYQRFQQYSDSPVVESIDPYNRRGKGKDFPGLFCGAQPQQQRANQKKAGFMKQSQNDFEVESSNRIHRLSNLIKALKE